MTSRSSLVTERGAQSPRWLRARARSVGLSVQGRDDHSSRGTRVRVGQQRGPRGTWRWARNAIPVVASAAVRIEHGPAWFRIDLAPGALLSVNRDASRWALLTGFEFGLRRLALEPYARGDVLFASQPFDAVQLGVAIGARWERGSLFGKMEARLRPFELEVAGATSWGMQLASGVRF